MWLEIKGNKIINGSCSCEDFKYRRLKKKENKVTLSSFCKHLNKLAAYYHSNKRVELGHPNPQNGSRKENT